MIPNKTSITLRNAIVPFAMDSVDVVRPHLIRPSLLLLSSSAAKDPNAENVPSVLCVGYQLSGQRCIPVRYESSIMSKITHNITMDMFVITTNLQELVQ